MSRKTRVEYEEAIAVLQARTDGKLAQRQYRDDVAAPYLYAHFTRNSLFEDAVMVGADLGALAAQVRGYLTCHTCNGMMEWSIAFSRELDERDVAPVVVPAETTERLPAAGVRA